MYIDVEFNDTELKYSPGTKVVLNHDFGGRDVFYVHKYQRFTPSFNKNSTFERYIIRRLRDDHQISMVNEDALTGLNKVRENKLESLLNE